MSSDESKQQVSYATIGMIVGVVSMLAAVLSVAYLFGRIAQSIETIETRVDSIDHKIEKTFDSYNARLREVERLQDKMHAKP